MRAAVALLLLVVVLGGAPAGASAGGALILDGDRLGENGLYVVNDDGSGFKQLVDDAGGPLWSPDGNKVAFGRDYGLFVIGSDGSGLRRLTPETRLCCGIGEPSWSPDGTRLVYAAVDREGDDSGAFVTTVEGEEVFAIPNGSVPAWSPDGAWIAFVRDGVLEVVASDGGAPKAFGSDDSLWAPVWAPDSRRLAFLRDQADCCDADIFVLDIATGKEQLVGSQAAFGRTLARWSPDSQVLAFSRAAADGFGYDIFAVDLATGQERRITPEPGMPAALAWSPDGSSLAFVFNGNVVRASPEGGSVQLLAGDLPFDSWETLVWSPDSEALAFVDPPDVWTVLAEGGPPRPLTKDYAGSFSGPSWHPRSAPAESLGGSPVSYGLPVDPVSAAGVLRARGRPTHLAMDGTRLVIAMDGTSDICGYIEFWDTGDGSRDLIDSGVGCPDEEYSWFIAIALAGKLAVYRGAQQSNHYYPFIGTATVDGRRDPSFRSVRIGSITGLVSGDGEIYLTTHERTDETTTRSTVWRVGGKRAHAVRSYRGLLRVVAVGEGRVALVGPNGRLVLTNGRHGRPLFQLHLAKRISSAALDGRSLLVQTDTTLTSYNLRTGASVKVFSLRPGFQLEDSAGGIAALRGRKNISLLRLRDGRRAVIHVGRTPAAVQLENAGLAYSWTGGQGGQVAFLPFANVTKHFASR